MMWCVQTLLLRVKSSSEHSSVHGPMRIVAVICWVRHSLIRRPIVVHCAFSATTGPRHCPHSLELAMISLGLMPSLAWSSALPLLILGCICLTAKSWKRQRRNCADILVHLSLHQLVKAHPWYHRNNRLLSDSLAILFRRCDRSRGQDSANLMKSK